MMKETKFINCEQYVLARMFAAEEENEGLKAKVADHEATIKYLTERYDTLVNLIQSKASVKIASGTDRFIYIDCPWEKYDEEFMQWVELLGLEIPEITTNTNEEEN